MAYALALEHCQSEEQRDEFLADLDAPEDPWETYDKVWAAAHRNAGGG